MYTVENCPIFVDKPWPPTWSPERIEIEKKYTVNSLNMNISKHYFDDPYLNTIYTNMFAKGSSMMTYRNVILALHSKEFTYTIPLDKNRYEDGLAYRRKIDYTRTGPCTILEMMCGLADRMEVEIMQDPRYGDRTYEWFQTMLHSMGLMLFDDNPYRWDERKVNIIINKFIHRRYNKNGKGGLFTFRKPVPDDPRNVEIWYQMNWWVSENY